MPIVDIVLWSNCLPESRTYVDPLGLVSDAHSNQKTVYHMRHAPHIRHHYLTASSPSLFPPTEPMPQRRVFPKALRGLALPDMLQEPLLVILRLQAALQARQKKPRWEHTHVLPECAVRLLFRDGACAAGEQRIGASSSGSCARCVFCFL